MKSRRPTQIVDCRRMMNQEFDAHGKRICILIISWVGSRNVQEPPKFSLQRWPSENKEFERGFLMRFEPHRPRFTGLSGNFKRRIDSPKLEPPPADWPGKNSKNRPVARSHQFFIEVFDLTGQLLRANLNGELCDNMCPQVVCGALLSFRVLAC